ncbi:hypothetical protein [Aliiruegeria lutimaris]|uniref:Uncharacterized protein n=1 Tax=Aliiruegeria lutimaris TaxID=571298 RepID=A0A1G9JVR1_9RHOB|nr:hypothetical protein [Aliiruegeria lutimaris]SDL41244.1 hypothetical protein SAMN04488026_10846 [Aliiruegeria lutimaris]
MNEYFPIFGMLVIFVLVFYPDVPSWIRHLSSLSCTVTRSLLELLRFSTEKLSDVVYVVRMVTSARPKDEIAITGNWGAGLSEAYSDR